jgi:multidrug efflux pump subunit AcrA (membrane-fusion protein)
MAALSLGHAARLTGLGKITITRAIKSSWHSASRKQDGSYEIDPVVPEPAAGRLHALIPWRAARRADLRADEELRRRMALAEERLADLKAALEDMRAQRDARQAMAQARIRPARTSAMSRWPWLSSAG